MERLRDALQLPAYYICSQGTVATRMEALMILLRRLAYPNRWSDLVPVFGRTVSELSLIFNKVKLLLCSFIFPIEVTCIPLSFYHSWIWIGSVESLTVHLCLFAWFLFVFRLHLCTDPAPPLFAIRAIKMIIPMWFQTTHLIKNEQNTSTLLYYFLCISDYGWYLWQIPPPLRQSWPGMAWSWNFCRGCSRKRSSSYWMLGFYRWDPPTNSSSCTQSTNYVQWSQEDTLLKISGTLKMLNERKQASL